MNHPDPYQHFAGATWSAPVRSRHGNRSSFSRLPATLIAFALGFGGILDAAEPRGIIARAQFASETDAADWRSWAPRDEIAPLFSFDPAGGREGRGALKIATRKISEFGAWRSTLGRVRAGQTYCFNAWFRTSDVENDRRSVIARLQWLDANGKAVGHTVRPPEYPLDVARVDGWVKLESIVRAPETAAALDVQLSLGFDADGVVWWDRVSLATVDSPPARVIRAMTVHLRPRNSPSPEANVEQFSAVVRQAADQKPDIICFPEGMTVVGTGKTYVEVSEPIPGPTTKSLGALARQLNSYIVAGLYERVAPAVYNTAVLVDRKGELVGRYRKTHLPREEWEAGLTPGDSYPIFQTDFGKVGLLVCWDVQFPEPWRALGLQGAEVILLPIWGGSETLLRARAIENHAFVVSSSYDLLSWVVAPNGDILAEATKEAPVATAEVDLDRKIYQRWIGDMSTRTWKERRGYLGQ